MQDNNENKEKTDKAQKDIELRSEKVRNIVGKIPPLLLRVGIVVISIVILIVLVLTYLIPYPEYKDITVELYSNTPVVVKKAPDTGLFDGLAYDRHVNKGDPVGALCIGNALRTDFFDAQIDRISREQRMEIVSVELFNDSYLRIHADITGYVYFQQKRCTHVEKGDILYVIIPDTISEIYGICRIPRDEIDKIRGGQHVSIMLEKDKTNILINGRIHQIYPFAESGSNPEECYYKVEISDFPDSLRTCEDKYFLLPDGNFHGKILLSDRSLLKKLLGIE